MAHFTKILPILGGLGIVCQMAWSQVPSSACNYAPGPPPNDVPCTAISLPPGGCIDGCNTNATDMTNGQGIGADCQSHGNNIDVWYTFIANGEGFNFQVFHDTTMGGIIYTASSVDLVLYRESAFATGSDTCNINTMVGMACWEDDGSRVLHGSTGGLLTPGERYYFLVSSAHVGGENPGSFRVCFDNILRTPPSNSCESAQTLCNDQSFHESGAGFVPSQNIVTNTCFGGTKNQVKWYQFTFATSGTFGFNIVPDVPSDYDWILWNTSADPCAAIMPFPVACNWSGCTGPTGYDLMTNDCPGPPSNYDAFGDQCTPSIQCPTSPSLGSGLLNVNAGETYTILIDNFSSGTGYTFNFSNSMTAVIGPQAGFTIVGTDCSGPGLVVDMFADVVTPGFFYKWDMGDGTSYEGVTVVSHTYPDYSPRVARLTVVDSTTSTSCIAATEAQIYCPLNVTYADFYGIEKPEGIEVHWVTSKEDQSDYFGLQHSLDGIHFEEIGRVSAKGESHEMNDYEFLHRDAAVGANYYRVREVAKDGSAKYSSLLEFNRIRSHERELVGIFDALGRVVEVTQAGNLYFYHYSDGSTDKIWIQ